ncbi:DUF3679 domain-containing protein [Bacillus horti]|uniref:DUF3679 domain-containing protein n=1 Tax=Caldalkalibacillus horti TaxID=77523 RepID=A0ABT9VSZ7_9BACI|nr:DUF3679 domain-containing protein [Bacillus horti]MDQ0164111.1 hypothetical protein [Bacillus horti]
MLRFTIKLLLLLSTLLFGVLLGIQQAEWGIFSVNGAEKEEQESFYVKRVDGEHVEVAVLGESFSTEELLEKEELWKERNQTNKLSALGAKMGEVVYSVSRKSVEWLVGQLEKML